MKYEKLHLKEYYPILGEADRDPLLEIYLPYNMPEMHRENQKRPCLIVCPGGGYEFCSERESEAIALNFLPDGYNVFVLTYSTNQDRFPAQLREVAAVMDLIGAKAGEWNCDAEHVAIMGFSAGGHLAAHYTNRYNCKEVREVFPESRGVTASVLCYPVITASDAEQTHVGSISNLVGHYPVTAEEEAFFSCAASVTDATPPAFIWHCSDDGCVPVLNSLRYAEALSAHGIQYEMHIFPAGGHGLSTSDPTTCDDDTDAIRDVSRWIPMARTWLRKHI